jgi:hypothetical protein
MARAKKKTLVEAGIVFTDMQVAILRDNYDHVGAASAKMAPFQIAFNTATSHLEENVRRFLVEQGGEEIHNLISAERVKVDDKTLEVTILPDLDAEDDVVGEPTEEDAEDAPTKV